jgi:NAD(P)-dependent dehydrogenase (short-subunit alcohol dehydrogenase family)
MDRPTVLITGSNRGLGAGLCRTFAARGYRVFAAARSAESLPPGTVPVRLDVDSDESVVRAAAEVSRSTDRLDVLINNAGRYGEKNALPPERVSLDEMRRTFETNVIGPLRVTRAFLPLLRKGSAKRVVQITSQMGSIANNRSGGSYDYRVSKAALNMMNRNLAHDLGREGFVCIALHPGWVRTDMGGPDAPMDVETSAVGMTETILSLTPDRNGAFLRYDGKPLPF